ncbi:transposase [Aetokthonos hydrillicola Thurmond2011]|uniref:Transposase n=1 Tax=Aetokthonos hydrillicola Thurmond2011 TaxID=2712845 RepID=A0AAP5IDG9_9CYAN|nr:transposase [Aetokthonos hydrillicola]MDR9896925.1 transposase [Aetokthonos hydrillicola Thurmond2011]
MYKDEPQILTVVCKLETTNEQDRHLENLSLIFAATCNYINSSVPDKYTGATKIQKLIYADAKTRSGLQANHVIQACIRVAGNRKNSKVKEFKPGSVLYDARTFTLSKNLEVVSLCVLSGRIKVKLILGDYQRKMLDWGNGSPSSATLSKHSDGWYLHIQVKVNASLDIAQITEKHNYLGVDLGRKDIASVSNGMSFSGEKIEKTRTKYSKIRARLQYKASTGTRSSRRRSRQLQKRLAGKERRFQAWLNHNIACKLILEASFSESHIVLEDLTGIRERTNTQPRSREQRFLANSWSFYQLKLFIQYKANIAGIPVVLVNPRYTSQTCHKCLHIHPIAGSSYRNGKDYCCGHCGWKGDADYNAANVIKQLGAKVNSPCGSEFLACNLSVASIPGLLKAHCEPGVPGSQWVVYKGQC